LIGRLPQLEKGFSLDLDSTIFSRHGTRQQGAAKGYNPRRVVPVLILNQYRDRQNQNRQSATNVFGIPNLDSQRATNGV
jgi:hypothetical protein